MGTKSGFLHAMTKKRSSVFFGGKFLTNFEPTEERRKWKAEVSTARGIASSLQGG